VIFLNFLVMFQISFSFSKLIKIIYSLPIVHLKKRIVLGYLHLSSPFIYFSIMYHLSLILIEMCNLKNSMGLQ